MTGPVESRLFVVPPSVADVIASAVTPEALHARAGRCDDAAAAGLLRQDIAAIRSAADERRPAGTDPRADEVIDPVSSHTVYDRR